MGEGYGGDVSDGMVECDECEQDVSARFRCPGCGLMVCADCTNFPADDEGPCVECEAKAREKGTVAG